MNTLAGSAPTYLGLSTDDKPLDVPVNTLYIELDTEKISYFTGETWEEMGGANA